MTKHPILASLFAGAILLSGCSTTEAPDTNPILTKTKQSTSQNTTQPQDKPFQYKHTKQLKLKPLDSLGRAQGAHIQLTYKDKPKTDREPYLKYNPSGWHNYRVTYKKPDGKISKYWTFNRSHLIGYLFSGLNDEPRNLVTGTSHLNKGSYNGMDAQNKNSMLYYEMHLNDWLKHNPGYALDYQVTPIYKNNELLPRSIRLSYTGFTNKGKPVAISTKSNKETSKNNMTSVTLDNKEPNMNINYKTGTAYQIKPIGK